MGLTLEVEERLRDAELIAFFDAGRATWQRLAQRSYNFVKGNFPEKAAIRPDDVAKALMPLVEVDRSLRDKLNRKKLKQKYWILYFTDLIIDRTWQQIATEKAQ